MPPDQRKPGQIHPSYLQTLAQLHQSWQFGGIAQLVDNSRDAHATRVDISISMVKMKGKSEPMPMLRIRDNGKGMNHEELVRMLQFGSKGPGEYDKDQIGLFGLGFKSGSMSLGKDVLVLTKSEDSHSIGFLSTSYNADKEVLEIPIVTYRKVYGILELDESAQTEEQGESCLQAVKKFSPFNELEIGSLFHEIGDRSGSNKYGTSIFIYNLHRWGEDYALSWDDEHEVRNRSERSKGRDITIRSGRVRARPSQISKEIPLDYSLRSYLAVLFLDPRIIIRVQGSKVKPTRLLESLSKRSSSRGTVCNTAFELSLGKSNVEYGRGNCGLFLYWRGRLIEVDGDGELGVQSTKQSFEDCDKYAMLERWLADQFNDYWVAYGSVHFLPVQWVQCDKCQKWRKLPAGVNSSDLLEHDWFCHMKPYDKTCSEPEEEVGTEDIVLVDIYRTSTPSNIHTTGKAAAYFAVEIELEDEDTKPAVAAQQSRDSVTDSTQQTLSEGPTDTVSFTNTITGSSQKD